MAHGQGIILALTFLGIRAVVSPEVPVSDITITPTSISAGKATVITFTGVIDGDRVEFTTEDCSKFLENPDTIASEGPSFTISGSKATVNVAFPGTDLKLCLKPASGLPVREQNGVKLIVLDPTPTNAIRTISRVGGLQKNRVGVNRARPTIITLTGAKKDSKAIFIPESSGCASAKPDVSVDAKSEGLFLFLESSSPLGIYKLCYQAPGGSDSVEQTPASGFFKLEVLDLVTTRAETIFAVSPELITVNIPTILTFTGTSPGDRAAFVGASSDCSETTPSTDVGAGHARFTIMRTGLQTLCYQSFGATDSIAQTMSTVKLMVKNPGIVTEMIERWQEKKGELDCSGLQFVAFCGASFQGICATTYMVQSGTGYKCFWNEGIWPARCDQQSSTVPSAICMPGKCANDMCWSTDMTRWGQQ